MREIKFRGCFKIGDSWEYGGIRYGDMGQAYILPHGATSRVVLVNRSYVGQYTGLKDKNNVEIYSGDILKYWLPTLKREEVGEVKWRDDIACFLLNGNWMEYDWIKIGKLEVIGNIYENPELLKEVK